jgi:hypothetical protein
LIQYELPALGYPLDALIRHSLHEIVERDIGEIVDQLQLPNSISATEVHMRIEGTLDNLDRLEPLKYAERDCLLSPTKGPFPLARPSRSTVTCNEVFSDVCDGTPVSSLSMAVWACDKYSQFPACRVAGWGFVERVWLRRFLRWYKLFRAEKIGNDNGTLIWVQRGGGQMAGWTAKLWNTPPNEEIINERCLVSIAFQPAIPPVTFERNVAG